MGNKQTNKVWAISRQVQSGRGQTITVWTTSGPVCISYRASFCLQIESAKKARKPRCHCKFRIIAFFSCEPSHGSKSHENAPLSSHRGKRPSFMHCPCSIDCDTIHCAMRNRKEAMTLILHIRVPSCGCHWNLIVLGSNL